MSETPTIESGTRDLSDSGLEHHDAAPRITSRRDLLVLSLGALGVVYGDLGTSPLYTIKECFLPGHGMTPSLENVLGVLSLVFWALTLAVVVKYMSFVMRADNHGEGGIMALLALILPESRTTLKRGTVTLVLLALFGTALLFSDGMITPVITVLGAVEGLEVATPLLRPLVVPITLVILVGLFMLQKRGTATVGALFGPAMLVWFTMIAALGAPWVMREPRVLEAILPSHGIRFLISHGAHGFLVLAAVVLCITGTEALYADMGHFGRRPIRLAWYFVAYPCLIINYLGQGAILLSRGGEAVANPFYALAPSSLHYPVVAVATVAAIIASQALISGSFSLAQQAMQLGYSPRLHIVHTSSQARGQIYVPEVNGILFVACCTLALAFRSSTNLAAAYGLAVTGTMAITSVLMFAVARQRWGWSRFKAGLVVGLLLCFDLPFLAANLTKVVHGGWVPLMIGGAVFTGFTTWKRGRRLLSESMRRGMLPVELFLESMRIENPVRVRGAAVFMTSNPDVAPPVLLHHVKHNKVLHEQVILLCVMTENVPKVSARDRVRVRDLGHGIDSIEAHYGFMETPDVPQAIKQCRDQGLRVRMSEVSYYLGRETLLIGRKGGMWGWRKSLFSFLSRNARPATAFFKIPPNRVVELGMQVEL
ncbi:MAG TPA: potassium transporter Kup [Thermoanaerobaculaceae bacterium]|nr:potassium transporter Kup [Thermoanaerobaculaceae bacterium]